VQWDLRQVRLLNPSTGQLLREHLRQARGGLRIQDQDRVKHTPLGTQQLLCRADHAGEQPNRSFMLILRKCSPARA